MARKVNIDGFLISGNRILRNLTVTREVESGYLDKVIQGLTELYESETDEEKKWEVMILVKVLSDTLYEIKNWVEKGESKEVGKAVIAFREVLKYKQYLQNKEIFEKGIQLARYVIEALGKPESKYMDGIKKEVEKLVP